MNLSKRCHSWCVGKDGSDENDETKFVCKVLCAIVSVSGFAMETMFLSSADRKRVRDTLAALDASETCDPAKGGSCAHRFNFENEKSLSVPVV